MRKATRRLFSVAVLTLLVWTIGTVVAVLAGWSAQFGGQRDPGNAAGELVERGTEVPPPLLLMGAIVVFMVLAPLRGFWGVLGVGGLCYLSLGYVVSPHHAPYVPDTMLVASGVVGGLLSVALLLSGIAELADREQARRRYPRMS